MNLLLMMFMWKLHFRGRRFNVKKLYVYIVALLAFPLVAAAFNLSATVSGGSGSWSGGVYQITGTQTLNFSVTPSGGTGPYTYAWNFPWLDGLKDRYVTDGGYTYDDQNPSISLNSPGNYDIEVVVTDTGNGNATEMAIVRVQMYASRSVTKAAKADCGAAGNGSTDDTLALQTCINTHLSSGGVLSFEDGTYRIAGDYQGGATGHTYGLSLYSNTTLTGGPGVTLRFDPGNTYGQDASGCDNNRDEFLDIEDNSASNVLVTGGMTLQYYYTGTRTDYDNVWAVNQGGATLENITLDDFTSITSNSASVVRRVNLVDMGAVDTDCRGDGKTSTWYASGNSVLWRCYYTNSRANDVLIYTGAGRDYVFGVENIIFSNTCEQALMRSYNTASGSDMQHHYWVGNYIDSDKHAIQVYSAEEIDLLHIHILNNKMYRNTTSSSSAIWFNYGPADCSSLTDILIDGNTLSINAATSDRYAIHFGNAAGDKFDSNVTVSNNTWGANLGGSGDPDTWGWASYLTQGSDCGGGDAVNFSGNTDDSTSAQETDPGVWEFTAPTNNGSSATDSGSGLGATARWPFSQGALAQGHDGSNNYTQVELYADRDNLSGSSEIRYADVDHNWSSLETNINSSISGVSINP